MSELVPFDFHGDALECIPQDGKLWVAVKSVCHGLGLNPDGQRVKLKGKPWACTETISVQDAMRREQPTFCLDLDSLPMWLATIEPSRIKEAIRPKLEIYQKECAKTLANRFLRPQQSSGLDPLATIREVAIALAPAIAVATAQALMPLIERMAPRPVPGVAEHLAPAAPSAPRQEPIVPYQEIPQSPTRKKLNRHMREHVAEHLEAQGLSRLDSRYQGRFTFEIRARYHMLDRALYDRCSIDLPVRAKNMGLDRLDAAERIDAPKGIRGKLIDVLYALAQDMYPLHGADESEVH